MKKFLISFCMTVVFAGMSHAATYNAEDNVQTIGSNLLTKNGITTEIKFETTSKTVDNSTFSTDKTVSISKDDLSYAGNDNETAAVVANELGHIIAGHASKNRLVSSITGASTSTSTTTDVASSLVENYQNTKAEKEADVIAVNLMANAGYNPLAAIVVLTKQTSTYWDTIKAQPANAERAMNIYDYANYAYPNSVKSGYNCTEYKNFLTYAQTTLDKRTENKKLQTKLEKELQKYRKNSVSQISKFKTRGGLSGWDAAYGLLNGQ